MRKTFNVEDFKVRINNICGNPNLSPKERSVAAHLWEAVSMDTGNYLGFRWLAFEDVDGTWVSNATGDRDNYLRRYY